MPGEAASDDNRPRLRRRGVMLKWQRLPDTVDPRGPKGK